MVFIFAVRYIRSIVVSMATMDVQLYKGIIYRMTSVTVPVISVTDCQKK